MLNIKKDNYSENLSKKINLKYGLYCIRGEDFSAGKLTKATEEYFEALIGESN